jgi:uncharacterized membrane protein
MSSDRNHRIMATQDVDGVLTFPISAGLLLGLGLGGFFDGIVLHQILQWHHVVSSAGYAPDTIENLRINTFYDGLFYVVAYVFVVLGLATLWRAARRRHLVWSWKQLIGTILVGFGAFNLLEGLLNHHVLGLHHVNETAPQEQWIYWDIGFLIWGGVMILAGVAVYRSGRKTA